MIGKHFGAAKTLCAKIALCGAVSFPLMSILSERSLAEVVSQGAVKAGSKTEKLFFCGIGIAYHVSFTRDAMILEDVNEDSDFYSKIIPDDQIIAVKGDGEWVAGVADMEKEMMNQQNLEITLRLINHNENTIYEVSGIKKILIELDVDISTGRSKESKWLHSCNVSALTNHQLALN